MHSPDFLKEGDKVRIVATARKVSPEELKPAILKLKDWGLRVELGENIFAQEHQFAGNDTQRADDLQNALNDRDCAAILCARGGYGTVRIIDKIDWDAFKQNPKWIIGYSDVSVLHNTLQNMGFASLHASMALDFTKNSPESLTLIREALFGQYYQVKAPAHAFNQLGSVEGEIVGGNLSMLYSCLGSQSAIKPAGQILFFEDLDEYLYHIDRMMQNLGRNNYLNGIKALLIGTLNDMNDNKIPFGESAEEIVSRHANKFDFPIAFGLPFGHSSHNLPLIFGQKVTLEVNSTASILNFNHGAKS